MKRKKLFLLGVVLFGTTPFPIVQSFDSSVLLAATTAEKPVKYRTLLGEAKTAIKNAKNQANAEKNLLAIVNREDITKPQRAEIYFMAGELQRSQNDVENMKLYLKQAYDTTKFFSTILKVHEYMLACDSVETIPDDKGNVKYKYRAKSREILKTYRSNLLSGGKFLLKRGKYAEAFPYFDMYLRTAKSTIFEVYPEICSESQLPHVAYWATLSAYNANQPKAALVYIDEAMQGTDDSLRVSLQEYKVRCYEELGEQEAWMENMLEGNRRYPGHDYFYLHLMDVYIQKEQYDEGIALCDSMLQRVGDRGIYWFGESQMYLGKKDYDETIRTANEALRCDSTLVDAYYNKGISYLNKATLFAETACNDIRDPKCKKDREILMELYRNAQKPFEKLREMTPDDSARWASPLYRVYLHLNMGKEFAEMEKILNAQ